MKDQLASFEKMVTIAVVLLLAGTPILSMECATGSSTERLSGEGGTRGSVELSIESVVADRTHVGINERVNVTVTVRNDGDEDAHYVDVYYSINGEDQYFRTIDRLRAGETENVTYSFQGDARGKYTLTFTGKDDGMEFDEESVDIYVESQTIYVDDDAQEGGNGSRERPYRSIQQGVDNATKGDIIRVFNGTYHENIHVDTSVSIIGNHSSNTTIIGSGIGDVVQILMNNILFEGFTVTNSEIDDYYAGIHVQSEYNQIKENNCSGNNIGIFVEAEDSNQIINNTCSNNDRWGISLLYSNSNDISENDCSGNDNDGIYLRNADSNVVRKNICTYDGIYLRESGGNRISENIIENSEDGIYLRNSHRNRISNNTCMNNDDGILSSESDMNTISDNVFTGHKYADITVRDSTENLLRNNTMTRGIYINGDSLEQWNTHDISKSNQVHGKPVLYYKNATQLSLQVKSGQIILADCSNLIIENLTFNDTYNGISIAFSSEITIRNCSFTGHTWGLIFYKSDANTIADSMFRENDYALNVDESVHNFIANNSITDSITGIEIEDGSDFNVVEKNRIIENLYGIDFSSSSHNDIKFNTVTENRDGISFSSECEENSAHYNNIFDNTGYGVEVSDKESRIVNATDNWWGNASGPYHEDDNPSGTGDSVTDYVTFGPWLAQQILFQTLYVAKYGNDTTGNGTEQNPFRTIQKAVNESGDWDTIQVYKGVYEENGVVNKSVEIVGNGSRETVIQGVGGPDVGLSLVGHYDTAGNAYGVEVSGDYSYIADRENGLVVIDISDPENPYKVGGCDTNDAIQVAVNNGYAYIADGNHGLVVVNISDPENPHYAGGYDTDGMAWGVAVDGSYAYIADDDKGLVVVDVSDPENPQFAGHYNPTGYSRDVVVRGNYAYVAASYRGLVIIDVSNPENPRFVNRYDTPGQARGIALSGDYAYVGDQDNGLVIVDVSDPENPRLAANYDEIGGGYRVSSVFG